MLDISDKLVETDMVEGTVFKEHITKNYPEGIKKYTFYKFNNNSFKAGDLEASVKINKDKVFSGYIEFAYQKKFKVEFYNNFFNEPLTVGLT
mmetsp:Transcript_41079/g.36419  ORF Transcript_41079/g.36419 Transcript_41079/m.36419 type:complete len:92 (-) Transcript_41079:950-1225(-)